jgi:hypothetical protein
MRVRERRRSKIQAMLVVLNQTLMRVRGRWKIRIFEKITAIVVKYKSYWSGNVVVPRSMSRKRKRMELMSRNSKIYLRGAIVDHMDHTSNFQTPHSFVRYGQYYVIVCTDQLGPYIT